ncbi:MAG: hypothetical protein M0R80_03330 [Proteobacteria bacterium]|jgi:hypothetical protein|nr:hypothetical protein [Pseudomonadota bacterium]
MSTYVHNAIVENGLQSEFAYGDKLAKRHGFEDGPLHRRRQGTIEQFDEWIANCLKDVEEGKMCPVRARKIIERWWTLREKKANR